MDAALYEALPQRKTRRGRPRKKGPRLLRIPLRTHYKPGIS